MATPGAASARFALVGLLALGLVAGLAMAPAAVAAQESGDGGWFGQGDGGSGWFAGDAGDSDTGWFGQSGSDSSDSGDSWFGQNDGSEDDSTSSDAGDWLSQDGSWFDGESGGQSDGSDGGDAITWPTTPSTGDDGVNRTELEMAVHEGINDVRAENGLGPLSFDEGLREVARYHSEDMASNGYFSHTSPSGETMTDRYQRFDYQCRIPLGEYRYATGAENIFMYGSSAPSEQELADMVVDGWMNSEGHRANILDENHRREGIGVAVSDDGSVYVTQNFC